VSDWEAWKREVDLDEYEARWQRLERDGLNPHGEADLVASLGPARVLDGGCGTGRVAIELARRGIEVVGVDLDVELLDRARAKAPELTWVCSDLSALELGRSFDVVVLAGNVIPFAEASVRPAVVAACARHLATGGRLVAGFSLRPGWPALDDYDRWCAAADLVLAERCASWDRLPFVAGGSYAVSVHRLSREGRPSREGRRGHGGAPGR